MGKQNEKAELTGKAKEDYDKRVAAQSKPTEAKRRMLTPAEKVAKLEADLAAARKKAEERADKVINQAKEKRAKLVEKRDALNDQIRELTVVIGDDELATQGAES